MVFIGLKMVYDPVLRTKMWQAKKCEKRVYEENSLKVKTGNSIAASFKNILRARSKSMKNKMKGTGIRNKHIYTLKLADD